MIAAPPPAAQSAPSAPPAMTAGMESSHQAAAAFLTARKFAEFLHQQQQQQRQKELNETTPPASNPSHESPLVCPKKRARPEIRESFGDDEDDVEDEDDEGVTKLDVDDDAKQSLMPLELIRARWTGAESPSAESAGGSSVGSSGHTEPSGLGREVKKRRLDELLSKKFSVADSPPNSSSAASSSISPPPIVTSSTQQQRQPLPSSENSGKKTNRRKPSSPVSSFAHPNQPSVSVSVSAASLLSLRPPSELFARNDQKSRESPIPRRTGSKSPHRQHFSQQQQQQQHQQLLLANVKQEEAESDLIKAQLMQLQLAQAALLSGAVASSAASSNGSGFPGLAGSGLSSLAGAGNPLLYYGYYAQMLQNLQSQQQKLLEQLASQKSRFLASPSSPSTLSSMHHDASKLLMASPSHHLPLITASDAKKKHVSHTFLTLLIPFLESEESCLLVWLTNLSVFTCLCNFISLSDLANLSDKTNETSCSY